MNKVYFVDAIEDKDGGNVEVIVHYKGHRYSANASCHPEDNFSSITGGRIAETRAIIKALKDEHKRKKDECEIIRKYIKALHCYKDFDSSEKSYKVIYKQFNTKVNEVNKLANDINNLELTLSATINNKDRLIKKIKEKKSI